jgi:hypothetical protein
MTRCAVAAALAAVSLTGCGGRSADGPHTITASSDVYTVAGQYSRVPLDRVDGLTIEQGKLMLHGAPANIAIDLPAGANPERPTRHWALVSDAHLEGRRLVTFTETESVTDFALDLPDGEAPLWFRVFDRPAGGEVLVFASGDAKAGEPSIFGFVTIARKSANVRDDLQPRTTPRGDSGNGT